MRGGMATEWGHSIKPLLFVPDYVHYADPFLGQFDLTKNIFEADCLMLTGGEDVDPATYGEPVGKFTHYSDRDAYELDAFRIAQRQGIPTIGICRGAQLLCALAGGSLVQHTTGHTRGHPIVTNEGEEYVMSSLHHQMMRPERTEHVMIAWSKEALSSCYLDGRDQEIYGHEKPKEPEIVYFPTIRGLGIQGHPEMLPENHPTVEYCNKLVKQYLFTEK